MDTNETTTTPVIDPGSLPKIDALTPEEAASVAAGIIGLFDAIQLEWVAGDYFQYDDEMTPIRACSMGAVQLAAQYAQVAEPWNRPNDPTSFELLFGKDGLDADELRLLTDGIIRGNDGGPAYNREQYGYLNLSKDHPTRLKYDRIHAIQAFGYTIGSTVRQHFNPTPTEAVAS